LARVDEYLEEILHRDGSDLHFMAGDPPRIRQYGKLSGLRADKLAPDFVREALYEIMPRKAVERFEARDGTDFAYTLGSIARFRVNVMRHLNGMGGGNRNGRPISCPRHSPNQSPHYCTQPDSG
jgi:twitching motility protein PilT